MIPQELRAIPAWVCWRWETREGKRTKPPIDAKTGGYAKSTDPTTWATFSAASFRADVDGIGFVVTEEDPYLGVDIDHCVTEAGIDPQAQAIIDRLGSYTEVTVSGQGVRVWVKAKLTKPGNKKHLLDGVAIEFYDRKRFFTVTGANVEGTPTEIHDRQAEIDALHAELFQPRPPQAGPFRGAALSLSDLDLLAKAREAKNGANFDRLWSGDTSGHGNDDSSADLALLCHLAFWTGKDSAQMDRLFRQSGLYRPKWEREDYRIKSLGAAIDRTEDVWTPEGTFTPPPRVVLGSSRATADTDEEGPPPEPDGLIEVDDLADSIDAYYDHGAKPGEHPGWDSLANLYRPARGEWTLVTGVPSHGKSTFLDAMIANLISNLGWRFAICSPENQPLERHFAQLAEKIIGKPFTGPNRMSPGDLAHAKQYLQEYVTFAMPAEPTIDAVLAVALRSIEKRGLDGMVLDPWNEIEHSRPSKMSETEYISFALSRVRRFARQHAIHLWIVAHPTKLQKEKVFGENGKPLVKDGRAVMEYPVPDPYSVSGSAHWRNKADNCLSVWRDLENDPDRSHVHVQKVRFKQNGKPGVAELLYQPESGRFLDTGIWRTQGRANIAPQPPKPPAKPTPRNFTEPEPWGGTIVTEIDF